MSNVNTLASSGERLSFYKLFSEKKYSVEIPIIQRDYAQGRSSEYEVRASFLEALNQYLIKKLPNRDLDFVYGSLTKDGESFRFVPLDGQQRLTTLFLLHWYLAQISNQADVLRAVLYKNEKSLFRYETRASSSEFCDALIGNNIDMSNLLKVRADGKASLSKTIQDQGWFHLSWMNDPTIQSMLTMLDSINDMFSGHPEFFDRLIDIENPIITFLFLDLKEFNLSDDLYIKMNARGKPLTDFENFKAKFEQRIKSFKNELLGYELNLGVKKNVDGYEYFVHKIDTDWADLFWHYRNQSNSDETFDNELMNFIRLIIANHCLLGSNDQSIRDERIKKLFGANGWLNHVSFISYEHLKVFSPSFVDSFIKILDVLCGDGAVEDGIKRYMDDEYYYPEEIIFKKTIANNTSYPEKLRFYAFYCYLSSGKNKAELIDWMRVIYNLTENTIINNSDEYVKCLQSINVLSLKDESILETLKRNFKIEGFQAAQVSEEKIKAHLISKSNEWKTQIVDLEKHSFFNGQIGFALSFAGIVDYYRQSNNCEWADAENVKYIADFKRYSEFGSKVFLSIKSGSENIDYLWERAVLSKGKYFINTTAYRWSLLSTRLVKNNIERDFSWRRLLRLSEGNEKKWVDRQSYVKAVFDDPLFDVNNIKRSLQQICDSALSNPEIKDWKKVFIKNWELFKECKQGFIFKNGDEIFLLNESQRNHTHSELYSRVLELELKPKIDLFKPFTDISYQFVVGVERKPFLVLSQYVYQGKSYVIHVRFSDGKYRLKFQSCNYEECAKELFNIVRRHGFELKTDNNKFSYRKSCKNSEEVFDVLKQMCSDLLGE